MRPMTSPTNSSDCPAVACADRLHDDAISVRGARWVCTTMASGYTSSSASSANRCDGFFRIHRLSGSFDADQREVAPVPRVGGRPVLLRQPRRVGRHVREALVRDRHQRLSQQLPALLDGVGGHVVHAGEVGILGVELREVRRDVLVDRVVGPRARAAGAAAGTRPATVRDPGAPGRRRAAGAARSCRCAAVRSRRSAASIAAVSACCANDASLSARATSAPRSSARLTLRPNGVSCSSVAYESSSTSSGSRYSSLPKSLSPHELRGRCVQILDRADGFAIANGGTPRSSRRGSGR